MDTDIPTIEPEIEPEYVGAHSSIVNAKCQNWKGETKDDVSKCTNEATHTVVLYESSGIMQLAMCDECGEPGDVRTTSRNWSGEITD